MGLREDLQSDDDATRLDACRRATSEGDLELVPLLLDLALRDRADVKVMGGMAEMWSRVSHAAAGALGAILERLGETESAARAVGTDLQHDDEAVGELLYFLGKPAEAVRRELETHPEPRVRLRALKAVLSTHRTPELVQRMLADPSPLVRVEAATSGAAWDEFPRVLLSEAAPEVRLEIARQLRAGGRHADVVLEALERERDPDVRHALVECLPPRWKSGARVIEALRKALEEPRAETRRVAARALKRLSDAQVGQAIAARIPVETDRLTLYELLSYEHLARHGKDLPPAIATLLATTQNDQLRSAALHALVAFGWRAQPLVVPLAAHANADVRKAARFFLSKHESAPTLVQLRALKADGAAVRRELQKLVDGMTAAVKARGYEVPTPAPATDSDVTAVELSRAATDATAMAGQASGVAAGPPAAIAATRAPDAAAPGDANARAGQSSGVAARPPDAVAATHGAASAIPRSEANEHNPAAEPPRGASRAPASPGSHGPVPPRQPSPRTVPAQPGTTLALAAGERPATVTLRLACGTCGAHARVQLPVRYQSMDDDRYAARETTYEAGGWMNCPACAAAWCVETMLDLVEPRGGGERTLEWRGPGRQDGACVVSRPAD